MRLELLERALALAAATVPVALATDLETGSQSLVTTSLAEGDLALTAEDLVKIRTALDADRSGEVALDGRAVFVEVWGAPLRLLIVGAVHIAQALAPLAVSAGYRVTIIDPRGAFATHERFAGVELVHDWPDDALATLRPDRRTALVVLSHDPKIDDPALIAALASEAFYVGALGSRRSHAGRRQRLAAAGLPAAAIDRVHGPVGLAIGASSPVEIAIAIMAEITTILRNGPLAGRAGWYADPS